MLYTARPSSTGCAVRQPLQCPPHTSLAKLRKSCVVRYQVTPDTLENVVNLQCEGRTEKLTLINSRVHVKAIKAAFGLSTVQINGRIEPTDDDGFTLNKFTPQATLNITGQKTTEMAALFGEMAALHADLGKLIEIRSELKDASRQSSELKALQHDVAAIKRLVAEVVAMGVTSHQPDKGPDFTKTSQDGYTFDTWWEAQCLARDIIAGHTKVKPDSSQDIIHHEDHVVASGLHTT